MTLKIYNIKTEIIAITLNFKNTLTLFLLFSKSQLYLILCWNFPIDFRPFNLLSNDNAIKQKNKEENVHASISNTWLDILRKKHVEHIQESPFRCQI
jgi:hypothetical protein